ncbi:ester cyclase [Salinibacterium soli]|uniref:Ester cyclase n=1 Tax=Antiquaquibacter soli TaxID=3064523 RepID=A0ABT9BQJ5_9MICO|nr:ester cyclase [Protaetiibacter sp. WY-16]MDO7883214.1 ester cyclase [Protaetiibacter sp. WY-16]
MTASDSRPLVVADSPEARRGAEVVVDFFDRVLSARRDPAAAGEFIAEDFVDHDPAGDDAGPTGVIAKLGGLWTALPDGAYRLESVVAAADLVVTRSVLEARGVTVAFADFYRVREGRIAEHWHVVDAGELARQLAARAGDA